MFDGNIPSHPEQEPDDPFRPAGFWTPDTSAFPQRNQPICATYQNPSPIPAAHRTPPMPPQQPSNPHLMGVLQDARCQPSPSAMSNSEVYALASNNINQHQQQPQQPQQQQHHVLYQQLHGQQQQRSQAQQQQFPAQLAYLSNTNYHQIGYQPHQYAQQTIQQAYQNYTLASSSHSNNCCDEQPCPPDNFAQIPAGINTYPRPPQVANTRIAAPINLGFTPRNINTYSIRQANPENAQVRPQVRPQQAHTSLPSGQRINMIGNQLLNHLQTHQQLHQTLVAPNPQPRMQSVSPQLAHLASSSPPVASSVPRVTQPNTAATSIIQPAPTARAPQRPVANARSQMLAILQQRSAAATQPQPRAVILRRATPINTATSAAPRPATTQQPAGKQTEVSPQATTITPPAVEPATPIRETTVTTPPAAAATSVSSTTRPPSAQNTELCPPKPETYNKACQVRISDVLLVSKGQQTDAPEVAGTECQTETVIEAPKEVKTYVDRASSPVIWRTNVKVKQVPKRRKYRDNGDRDSDAEIDVC